MKDTQPSLSNSQFLQRLQASRHPLLADGAMGTMLHARGVGFDQCFDELNLTEPALVDQIHREYIEAGSQLILTNTFGANRYKLAVHGLQGKVAEVNRVGVELARRIVLASYQEVMVAGSVGPLGVRLIPYGRVHPEHARAAFSEQISALAEAGADLIVIETISDINEIHEAVVAARKVCDLPVVASMTFTRDDRTLMGETPAIIVRSLHEMDVDVIGVNCSGGPAQVWRVLREMRKKIPQARFYAKPNAGWPEQVGGRIMYPASPDYFGDYAQAFSEIGVSVVGGCCGTTPAHIEAMKKALERMPFKTYLSQAAMPVVEPAEVEAAREHPTQLAGNLAAGKFVVSVEMDPPRGLSAHRLLAGASLLKEVGADVINVADSPMASMRMSPWAVCDLIQQKVGIETTLHFPTRGRNLLRVQGDLLAAHALGIRNVFVVMGDPTSIGDYPDAMDDYDLVPSGLIGLIKGGLNAGKDHAGTDIGQPTSFFVGCALNITPQDVDREIKVLRRKIRKGADFALTQPIYQREAALAFLERYEDEYGPLDIPLLVGVLPLISSRHAAFLHNEVPGISIPEAIYERLEAAGDEAPHEGVRMAVELIDQMGSWASGIYLMPAFGRYDLAAEITEAVKSPGR